MTPGTAPLTGERRRKKIGMSIEDMRELARTISTGSDSQELDFGMAGDEEEEDREESDSNSHESDAPETVETENPTPSTSRGAGKGQKAKKGKGRRTLTQLEKVTNI